ncbi:(Fe-S)-binding protein [Klebsiella pneumoniae subsp. pneumoniae]|nr:(Fe-S)-binding protein [Klebsiella pneumoniae subsp. pneumoniae]
MARTRNSWHARKGEYDFSHEVKEAMSGCLACKACSTQCPIKIDVPEFRSALPAAVPTAAICGRCAIIWWPRSNLMHPLMAQAPKTFNFLLTSLG